MERQPPVLLWALVAVFLVAWLLGILVELGPWVNFLLVAAAVVVAIVFLRDRGLL